MHFMMAGLAKLPDIDCVCYRGMPGKAEVLLQYKMGRPIQWGAFTSTTRDSRVARSFTNPHTGVIFKVTITSGRDINPYSFFPAEGEVLLSPNHRFLVSSHPYNLDGYTFIDLIQVHGGTFVS